ncbi:hypothetical protein C4568_02060 [Candidatus Parcubacteria bacterium]|nr:MAG: hypothetical protein C4568_02060 [Candidatus Parcubacteria bacterium]
MKSSENFSSAVSKAETQDREIAQKSPETEVVEIRNDQLEQYASAAETRIEGQAAEVLHESEKRIESSAQGMGMSSESFSIAEHEYGIHEKLRRIQDAADQIASEAKQQIQIIKQPLSVTPQGSEVRMESPAFIDNDPRYQAIEKELSDKVLAESIDILKRRGKSEPEALFHMEAFGGAMKDKEGKLRIRFEPWGIHKEFAQRYPEEYAQYQEKEKGRVYSRAHDDPAYAETMRKVYEAENAHMPSDVGHEYRGYTSRENIGKLWEARRFARDDFVARYPEKAVAYGTYDKNIEAALKRKEANTSKQEKVVKNIPAADDGGSFKRLVGAPGLPREQKEQFAKEVSHDLFENAKYLELEGEIPKTLEQRELCEQVDRYVGEVVEAYGGRNFTVTPDHVRIVANGDFELAGGEFKPDKQLAFIGKPQNDLDFTYLVTHELLHFKSYGASQIPVNDQTRLDMQYRVGLYLNSRDESEVLFGPLDEAITEMLTKQIVQEKLKNDLRFAGIGQLTDQIVRHKRDDLRNAGVPESDVLFLDANGDGRRYTYIEGRQAVDMLIDKIFEKNLARFKNREEVFDVFARAKFSGNILPLGRLIDTTFGSGTFRKIGQTKEKSGVELKEIVEKL